MLLASPSAVGDALSNVAPASQVTGLSTEFPIGNYALDSHFTAVSVGVFSGVSVSGVPPMIAYFLANTLWQLTAFLANALITLFTFAFSLNLVTGSSATGGAGALAPVASAVHTIYSTVFGAPWLTVAVVITGMWAMWKALVQRRYVETAGALAMSLIYVVIALAFVLEPQATIGSASRWTNEMSAAFLSLTSDGDLSSQQQAKQADADQLFDVLVYQPWVVLQFGGVEHCVTTGTSNSVSVQPLTASESQQLDNGTEIQVGDRTCINNANKYASHFLRYSPDSNDRTDEYNALEKGDNGDLPSSDPSKTDGSYKLGPADEPAAAAMGEGGQYQRLLLAIVVFAGECGGFLLLGALSVAVILAQVILLLLLAFAPVALVIAVFPGRGHEFFLGWLTRLATFLLRKAIVSLILAVLLAVAAALDSASADLGWLMSFGLEATFFWAVFLYRHQLTSRLSLATTGHAGTEGSNVLKLAYLSTAARALRVHGAQNTSSGGAAGGNGGAPSGRVADSGGDPQGRRGGTPPASGPPTPSGDTPPPPGNPRPPTPSPSPSDEPSSPAATPTHSEATSTVSTTRNDIPVIDTPTRKTRGDQPSAQHPAGAESAPKPTGTHQDHAEPGRPHEPSESHVGSRAAKRRRSTSSTAARGSREKPTGHSTTLRVKPSAAGSATPVVAAASTPPGIAGQEAVSSHFGSSPSAAVAETADRQSTPGVSPLAESVRRDLHRVSPTPVEPPHSPDRPRLPDAQPTAATRATHRTDAPVRLDAPVRPSAAPHRLDEREGR